MKSTQLREMNDSDLGELEEKFTKELFHSRMKNFSNGLTDTSTLQKARRTIARIKTIRHERTQAASSKTQPAQATVKGKK